MKTPEKEELVPHSSSDLRVKFFVDGGGQADFILTGQARLQVPDGAAGRVE
jgi:hypothetical protein